MLVAEKNKIRMIQMVQTTTMKTILKEKAESNTNIREYSKGNQKGRDFCSNRRIRQIEGERPLSVTQKR